MTTRGWDGHRERWFSRRVARQLPQVVIGSGLLGFGIALMASGRLGFGPWVVLAEGVSKRVGVSLGLADILLGIPVLLAWVFIRERPGIATVITAVEVGLVINLGLLILPEPEQLWVRFGTTAIGVLAAGVGIGIYLAADLGPGPRDGLMTGLHRLTGHSIRLIRTGVEAFVLILGFLLGGSIGIGTVLMALGIGPVIQATLGVFDREGRVMQRAPVDEI